MATYSLLQPRVSVFPLGLKPYCLCQMESTREGFENLDCNFGYIRGLSRPEAYALKRLFNSCVEYNCANASVRKCKHGGEEWSISFDYVTERNHTAPAYKFYLNGELTEYKDWRNIIATAGGLAHWDRFECQMGDTSEYFEWGFFKAVKED